MGDWRMKLKCLFCLVVRPLGEAGASVEDTLRKCQTHAVKRKSGEVLRAVCLAEVPVPAQLAPSSLQHRTLYSQADQTDTLLFAGPYTWRYSQFI